MTYVCEFEFYESGRFVDAVPLSIDGEGTFGEDLEDAVESAAAGSSPSQSRAAWATYPP